MHKEDARINCSIFQKQESVIKDITNKINAIKGVTEKAVFAEELRKEVDVLLNCQDYKKESLDPSLIGMGKVYPLGLDCKNCHFIANLRKKTADLIIKVKKLA